MQFSCQSCRASYRIPVVRRRPGGVRIRCKRCSQISIVSPPRKLGNNEGTRILSYERADLPPAPGRVERTEVIPLDPVRARKAASQAVTVEETTGEPTDISDHLFFEMEKHASRAQQKSEPPRRPRAPDVTHVRSVKQRKPETGPRLSQPVVATPEPDTRGWFANDAPSRPVLPQPVQILSLQPRPQLPRQPPRQQTRSVILEERPRVSGFSLAGFLNRFGRLPTWALICSGVVLGLVLMLLVLVVAPTPTAPGPVLPAPAGASVTPKRAHLLGGRSDPSKSATLDKKNKKRISKRSDSK